MGYAVAAEAARRGAEVVLISGPTALPDPSGVSCVRIETAMEMREAVLREYGDTDAVIMSAAVADYHVKDVAPQKIKKSDDNWQLVLERNPDILKELGANKKPHQVLVGFAAETCNLMEYARRKLEQKNLDYIVANDVTREGAGFSGETNVAVIISRDGAAEELPLMRKSELARRILDRVEAALGASDS
jgi:phosphopantothenoylcysteine decarboxylase/phosphopantothenate--cysteine ligase